MIVKCKLTNKLKIMPKFEYGEEELNHLKSRDKILASAIEKIGYLPHYINEDFFSVLVNSIIVQQISLKAADAIWNRLLKLFDNEITPEKVLDMDFDKIKSVGMSTKKVEYIRGAAQKIVSKELNIEKLKFMDDAEVTKELLKLYGVGNWTVEMLLIFSLGRKDILSYGDLTIIRGLQRLYGYEKIDKKIFEKYRELYSPYGSIASFYLWYIAEGKENEIKDLLKNTKTTKKTIAMKKNNLPKYIKSYKTKIGKLTIGSDDNSITHIFFSTDKVPENIEEKETKVIKQAINELNEYFDGKRKNFTVPLKPDGTEFQKKVCKALLDIPYGKTCSYRDIAEAIGSPKACRAVGTSNGKNPIPIIIPCHRVINSSGNLGGYSAGLDIKAKLMDIENIKSK